MCWTGPGEGGGPGDGPGEGGNPAASGEGGDPAAFAVVSSGEAATPALGGATCMSGASGGVGAATCTWGELKAISPAKDKLDDK